MTKKKYPGEVCFECGEKYGKLPKRAIGVWKGDCGICGHKDVPCADAGHDFQIWEMPKGISLAK